VQKEVPCVIFRGGTSKGVFFQEELIPPPGNERDKLLLRVMGSPDLRQIDGLGGATSTTSKVAIINKSNHDGADVDYTFAQVSIDKPMVDYKGNCGNISAAVGPYAIEMGYVEAKDPETIVRIYNTNTKKVILSYVKTPNGQITYQGDFQIAGVPGTASPVILKFNNPSGSVTGSLLPTGSATDVIEIEGLGNIEISIVDAANPLVFVKAEDIGLEGTELPDQIDSMKGMLELLEQIRGKAAVRLGFVEEWESAAVKTPAVPKMTIVTLPKTCKTVNGDIIQSEEADLIGRMMSMQKTHKTYALTGALCTAAAAVIPGTVVNKVIRNPFDPSQIRLFHPGGIMQIGVEKRQGDDNVLAIDSAWGYRTARMIMKGIVYY
jgi:2-methylaconitate cis-trans-isomerase PrpF